MKKCTRENGKGMEIGSIFEINPDCLYFHQCFELPKIPVENYHTFNRYYFNTGRAAIEAILVNLKDRGFTRVLLPSFLCDSVRDAALRAGMQILYYRVNADLSVDVDTIDLKENYILYVVQYFGQRINEDVLSFISRAKQNGTIVIEDLSLSLLSEDDKHVGFGDYIIGSLRKWFPIPDGGILLSKEEENFELVDASNDYTLYYFTAQILKDRYLKNPDRNESEKKVFLSYNNDGMKALFTDYTIRKMSRVSIDLMRGLDIDGIRNQRIENYDYLKSLLKEIPQVKVLVNRCGTMTPLGMVLLTEDRDELLKFLILKDIYCNVHWRSNESTKHYSESEYLASRCLTIPCDQRYGKEEMQHIYETMLKYYGD